MKTNINNKNMKSAACRFISSALLIAQILYTSSSLAQAQNADVEVKVIITQRFATDAERKANQKKFETMNQASGLKLKEREGVWTKMATGGSDLAELLEISRDFKDVLEKGIRKINQLRLADRLSAYNSLMEQVVEESKSTSSELLMRYALNRGLAAQELFSQEWKNVRSDMSKEALKALELRVLRDAVERAIELYAKDEKFLDILKNPKTENQAQLEMKKKFGFDLFEVSKLEFERDYANYIVELATNLPTHNGSFQLLKYTVVQLFNGINSSLLRNQSTKLKNILRNLLELGIELPENLPGDAMTAHSLNNMTKDNLELIIKDFNHALFKLKKELAVHNKDIALEPVVSAPTKSSKSIPTVYVPVNNLETILISNVGDSDSSVREEALKAVRKFNLTVGHLQAVKLLRNSSSWEVRREAAKLLSRIDHVDATAELISMLNDSDSDVVAATAAELDKIKMTEANIPSLIKLKISKVSKSKYHMVNYLASINTKVSIDHIMSVMSDMDSEVRNNAYAKLDAIILDDTYTKTLAEFLKADSWETRRNAAWLLGKINSEGSTIALISQMMDSDSDVKSAINEIVNKRKMTDAMIPALMVHYKVQDYTVRLQVTKLLGKIKTHQSTDALLTQLQREQDSDVKASIISISSQNKEEKE